MIESPPEIVSEGAPIPEGAVLVEGEPGDVVFDHLPGDEPCCEDGSCGGEGCHDQNCACFDCCCCFCLPCVGLPKNFSVYGGVHGFKGPINRGSDSSFGFDEAFNWGIPFGLIGNGMGMGAQLGVRGAQSNLSGATGLTLESRNQVFVTGGMFRRVDCGLQWGGVIDYLHEEWDVSLDMAQVRGEVSWMFVTQSEVGFRYTGGVTDDDADEIANLVGVDWMPTDTYALFFRQKLVPVNGECQLYVGVSDRSEGLLGANAVVPVAEHLSISAEFAYLVPEVGAANAPIGGALEESWNAGVGVVFYPDPCFLNPANYYRPLFDVANNGTFMYDLD
jgi:hypothetical protein